MRLAVGADERTHLSDFVIAELTRRGHDLDLFGALAPPSGSGEAASWVEVAAAVARRVAGGACDQGVILCWTGTGVSIAANKIAGVRAALCTDAQTAAGARRWNDANVLCLSLRLVSEPVAAEIIDAWFAAEFDASEADNRRRLAALEADRQRRAATY